MNSFFFPSSRVIPSGLFPEVGSQCQKRSYFQNCWWFLPSRLPKRFQLSLLSGEAPEWEPWHCVKNTRYSRVLSTPLSKEIRTNGHSWAAWLEGKGVSPELLFLGIPLNTLFPECAAQWCLFTSSLSAPTNHEFSPYLGAGCLVNQWSVTALGIPAVLRLL